MINYPVGTWSTVTAIVLNIRIIASDSATLVAKLAQNDRVKVLGYEPQWTKVDIGTLGTGWVRSDSLVVDKFVEVPTPIANPIMGKSVVALDKMVAFLRSKNRDFDPNIAKAFLAIGEKYGVRGDVALCQSIIETGLFMFAGGTAVTPDQHNYCGMGVTQMGMKGAIFSSIEDGVTAQMQHLFAYASKLPLPTGEVLLDPRFKYVTRGIAPNWEDLSNRWAMNVNYGKNIMAIYNDMLKFVVPAPPVSWEVIEGRNAVDILVAAGVFQNADEWKTEAKLMAPAPTWLLMMVAAMAFSD